MTQDMGHNTGHTMGCKKPWKEEVNTAWDFMGHLHMDTFMYVMHFGDMVELRF